MFVIVEECIVGYSAQFANKVVSKALVGSVDELCMWTLLIL